MKKTILTFALSAVIVLGSCNKSSKKELNEAKDNIKEAGQELNTAAKDANTEAKNKTKAEWETFKAASETEITDMDAKVKQLEAKISKTDKKENARLKSDLRTTRTKLENLKGRLVVYNTEFENDVKKFDTKVLERNEAFKREFKHDMDELGTAIKDLFKNNVK